MRTLAAAVLALALAAPAAGASRAYVATGICGPSSCRGVPGGLELPETRATNSFPVQPPPVEPYYRLRIPSGQGPAFFVPTRGILRVAPARAGGVPDWVPLRGETAGTLQIAAGDLEPFRPELSEVLVNGREAEDPEPYLRLYDDEFPPPDRFSFGLLGDEERVEISLRSDAPMPWTYGMPSLTYLPEGDQLLRGNSSVTLPKALARRIERDAGLIEREGGGFPWVLAGLGAGGLAAAAGGAWALRARRAGSAGS